MAERELATFDDVQNAENEEIEKRSSRNGKVKPFKEFGGPPERRADDCKPVLDTVGLALSGGGIRSAAFSLGVIQSLQVADVIKNIDYLSTVSGGGYTGCSMSAGISLNNGEIPFPSEIRPDESPTLQHIRDYSNYLIPHGMMDVVRSSVIYLRGLAANALQVGPVLLLAAVVTIYFNPARDKLSDPVVVRNLWCLIRKIWPGVVTFPSQLKETLFSPADSDRGRLGARPRPMGPHSFSQMEDECAGSSGLRAQSILDFLDCRGRTVLSWPTAARHRKHVRGS